MTQETIDLQKQFLEDLYGATEDAEQDLLRLEGGPNDVETIAHLYRTLHTLKGNAGLVGEHKIQTLCHSLESMLDKDHRERVSQELIQRAFEAVDVLRTVAENGNSAELSHQLEQLSELIVREHSDSHRNALSPAGCEDGEHRAWMELSEWKRIVRSFATFEQIKQTAFEEAPTKRRLQRLGLSAVDFAESLPGRHTEPKRIAGYAEQLIYSMTLGDPRSLGPQQELLERMLADIREYLIDLFRENNFSVTVNVKRTDYLQALLSELRRRNEAPVLLLKFEMEYDELLQDPTAYEAIAELLELQGHNVAILVPWSSTVGKAVNLLEQALSQYPVVSSNEWDALVRIAHRE